MSSITTKSRRIRERQIESANEPLSADELDKLDAYWRALNYLAVGQIYLLDNPLLKEPLKREHIKPRLLGHWSTSPGLNITPGPRVDLSSWNSSERNLRFADFQAADLTGANFSRSWLDYSRFNGANLTNASLQSAILTNALLFAANLTNADLSGADPTDADLGGNDFFDPAHLTNANLAEAIVTGAGFFETTSRGFTKEQLYSTAS